MEQAYISYDTNRWELVTNQDMVDIVSKQHWERALGNERGVASIRKQEVYECVGISGEEIVRL